MKKLAIVAVVASFVLASCGGSGAKTIATTTEKIGNLTIQAPVGWEKDIQEDDSQIIYNYMANEDGDALITIWYSQHPKAEISISDFDYIYEEQYDGIDIVYTDVNDSFLGDKPIRIGSGTWQYNYEGNIGDLFDNTVITMYDADCQMIEVSYMYKDALADKGYADYATTLIDTMELIYDYS